LLPARRPPAVVRNTCLAEKRRHGRAGRRIGLPPRGARPAPRPVPRGREHAVPPDRPTGHPAIDAAQPAARTRSMSSIVELTKDSFQEAITPDSTLIVDFWAPWCGPCRGFAPVFEQAAEQHPDVTFAKVNTDVEQELAGALGIRSIPTLMVFREQVLLFSQPGALSAGQLQELLEKIKAVDMEKVHQEIAAAKDGGAGE